MQVCGMVKTKIKGKEMLMKKRIFTRLLAITIVISLVGCGQTQKNESAVLSTEVSDDYSKNVSNETTESEEMSTTPSESVAKKPEIATEKNIKADNESEEKIIAFSINVDGISTTDELEVCIEEHLNSCIADLNSRWEELSLEIDTYEKYINSTDKISDFYETIINETDLMCIMLREYSAAYAKIVLDSEGTNKDKYKAIDGINNCLYDDACDEIEKEIYEGILDEMSDYFYEGILEEAEDKVNYSEWYEVCSDEYSQWYDTRSEVYNLYYDTASEIYSFYYDMSSELYSGDTERAEKHYIKFIEDIEKEKGNSSGSSTDNVTFDTAIRTATSIEELESIIDSHVSECIQALQNEWTAFSTEIDTYDKYIEKYDEIEAFHSHIEEVADQILVMICEYGISYSKLLLESDSSNKDKYKDFEDFKDCIYDDACDMLKDDIYDGILDDIKKYYYDGIINDAKDYVKYSDWSDVRSDAYSWWSDSRSEVYESWSDTRGDIYGFWSDIRSELYSGDVDKANEKLQDFAEDVGKMK